MNNPVVAPIYSQIALDIAMRIAREELKENTKVYGRSIMASEYGVSPETIRRAMKLLEDMEIVQVRPNSGAIVLSYDKARKYIERFSEHNDIRSKQQELHQLISQQSKLNQQILDITGSIVRINEKFSKSSPFPNYEVAVPHGCPLLGKTLGELKFWQQTGATVIAIRRDSRIILSPGPYAMLEENDILLFVGDHNTPEVVSAFLR